MMSRARVVCCWGQTFFLGCGITIYRDSSTPPLVVDVDMNMNMNMNMNMKHVQVNDFAVPLRLPYE
jgi:hypothetical protein